MPSPNEYFSVYIDTILEGLRRIKKIGFKKFLLLRDLFEQVEGFLQKEVFGRIEPASYLLVFLLALGSRSTKIYSVVIQTVQKLLSFNFIAAGEELSGALHLIKDQNLLKEFLLIAPESLLAKTFKEIYLETLLALPEREESLQFAIVRTFSLVWRISQSGIPRELVKRTFDYTFESILAMRPEDDSRLLKSALL